MTLPRAECTYRPSSDHTSGVSPVEIAHRLALRKPLDIVPLDPHVKVSRVRVAFAQHVSDVSFSCVVKTQRRWSNKIYKTELTKTRYNNQVLGKYRVDPQRAGLTLIAELTWSNLGLKRVLNKRK